MKAFLEALLLPFRTMLDKMRAGDVQREAWRAEGRCSECGVPVVGVHAAAAEPEWSWICCDCAGNKAVP